VFLVAAALFGAVATATPVAAQPAKLDSSTVQASIGGCANGSGGGFALRACISRGVNYVRPDFYVNAVPAGAPNCVILAYVYHNGAGLLDLTSHPCAVGYRSLWSQRVRPGIFYVRVAAYVNNVLQAEAYSQPLST
jgi:hypothetical protein